MPILPSAEIEFSPAFHDLDPMEIVWHGHYFKYFELARCALLQKINYDYPEMRDSGYTWPVVDLRAKYIRPARFRDALRVIANMVEWENRIKIEYRIESIATGKAITRGYTVQVAVSMDDHSLCFVTPEVFREKLAANKI